MENYCIFTRVILHYFQLFFGAPAARILPFIYVFFFFIVQKRGAQEEEASPSLTENDLLDR